MCSSVRSPIFDPLSQVKLANSNSQCRQGDVEVDTTYDLGIHKIDQCKLPCAQQHHTILELCCTPSSNFVQRTLLGPCTQCTPSADTHRHMHGSSAVTCIVSKMQAPHPDPILNSALCSAHAWFGRHIRYVDLANHSNCFRAQVCHTTQ